MGSNYFGEPKMGNEKEGSGSSRKGKKNGTDKPKQPQRGLGVAQLEKIRLHGQMGSNYHPYASNFNQEDVRMQTAFSSVASSSFSYYPSSLASSASYGFHPNTTTMMGRGDFERTNIRNGDSQPSAAASWNTGSSFCESQHFAHPSASTRHLLHLQAEDTMPKKHRSNSMGSSSQNSESSDSQELDLELRLSI